MEDELAEAIRRMKAHLADSRHEMEDEDRLDRLEREIRLLRAAMAVAVDIYYRGESPENHDRWLTTTGELFSEFPDTLEGC